MTAYTEHFALVRQINAEVGHIPQAALDAWQETDPCACAATSPDTCSSWADQGLLHIDDADRAAIHFVLLAATEVANRSYHGAIPHEPVCAEDSSHRATPTLEVGPTRGSQRVRQRHSRIIRESRAVCST